LGGEMTVVVSGLEGWYYVNFSEEGRLAFGDAVATEMCRFATGREIVIRSDRTVLTGGVPLCCVKMPRIFLFF
jgi:hypothetical protein